MFAGQPCGITQERIPTIARELHHYLEWRAQQEQQTYELTETFFADALRRGVRKFFGVEVNSRGIAVDTQHFALWHRWLQR
jgi:hypothetical protein